MRIGFTVPGMAPDTSPSTVAEFARRAEAAGAHSVWVTDRIMDRTPEPFVMLGAVAALTSKVRIGTAVLLGSLRPPLLVAKVDGHARLALRRTADPGPWRRQPSRGLHGNGHADQAARRAHGRARRDPAAGLAWRADQVSGPASSVRPGQDGPLADADRVARRCGSAAVPTPCCGASRASGMGISAAPARAWLGSPRTGARSATTLPTPAAMRRHHAGGVDPLQPRFGSRGARGRAMQASI